MTGRKKTAQTRRMLRTRRQLADADTRTALADELKAAYLTGISIRELAAKHHLAFATVRALLLEASAELRARGGPNHVRRQPGQDNTPPRNGRGKA